ncbi:hypothetical protein EC836_10443 [Erwinia sp. JUb26]|nr:hypothetical protein EC836_10443 [Erwinia sp. JUb26]
MMRQMRAVDVGRICHLGIPGESERHSRAAIHRTANRYTGK